MVLEVQDLEPEVTRDALLTKISSTFKPNP